MSAVKKGLSMETNHYTAKLDSRNRLLLKEPKAPFYDVVENDEGVIVLTPMQLTRKRKSLKEILASIKEGDDFTEIGTSAMGKEIIE